MASEVDAHSNHATQNISLAPKSWEESTERPVGLNLPSVAAAGNTRSIKNSRISAGSLIDKMHVADLGCFGTPRICSIEKTIIFFPILWNCYPKVFLVGHMDAAYCFTVSRVKAHKSVWCCNLIREQKQYIPTPGLPMTLTFHLLILNAQ